MSRSAIPGAVRRRVFERDRGRCGYCGIMQVGQGAVFHINHILPRSKGGATTENNLVLQCPHFSLHKADKTEGTDPVRVGEVPLFHPLQQLWQEHFMLDAGGICIGLTPTGRATVLALHMNDPLPRLARSIQIQLRLLIPANV